MITVKYRRHKRPLVLFEILIAFSLLSLAVFPFLRYPYLHLKKQIDFFCEMELERVASAELAKWQVAIYQSQEGLKERIFDKKTSKATFDRDHSKITVNLSKTRERTFYRKLRIYPSSRKKTQDGKLIALVNLELEYYSTPKAKVPILKAKRQIVVQSSLSSASNQTQATMRKVQDS